MITKFFTVEFCNSAGFAIAYIDVAKPGVETKESAEILAREYLKDVANNEVLGITVRVTEAIVGVKS